MIDPFLPHLVRQEEDRKVISYGLSSFGYDIRLSETLYLCKSSVQGKLPVYYPWNIDPKEEDGAFFRQMDLVYGATGAWASIPAYGFALGSSIECFDMPEDVVGVCVGKSTYARCGLIVNVTPLEPGWKGYLTLELHNTLPVPVQVYVNEGIAQIMFHQGERPSTTYKERDGKYQNQPPRPVFAKV